MTRWNILTCEYPPQIGGVSDYVHLLAGELHRAGDDVDVWAPAHAAEPEHSDDNGVRLHRSLGDFSRPYLESITSELRGTRLLVQWVPHGYGHRAMNLDFCRWLEGLSRSGGRIWLMIHEPCLDFRGSWKQRMVSLVQRRMLRILLRSASRAFISIPAWEGYLRPYAQSGQQFEWLPIPATIPVITDAERIASIRNTIAGNSPVVGHVGTYTKEITQLLAPALLEILQKQTNVHALIMGRNSDRFASELLAEAPTLQPRIHATRVLSNADLSLHISACDMMLQPYPDGLSSRRTSLMNVLAHGIAVVSNTGHLTEELWRESTPVALAESSRLAGECLRLLNEPASRRELAAKGLALYRSRFDWPSIISALRSSPEALAAHSK